MEHIPYPSNYTDPEPDTPRVQCTECGDWFDHSDMQPDSIEEFSYWDDCIVQGLCIKCHERNDDE